jgi:hypothetical protein
MTIITALYAALLGLVFVFLSMQTIRVRGQVKTGLGAGEHPRLLRAMRVHANFAEYTPLALIVIYFLEVQGANVWVVHALGLSLLLGRCLHAYGFGQENENFALRKAGMILTFSTILVSCVLLLVQFVLH